MRLVRTSAATVLCREAPRTVGDLERIGVHFDADGHGNRALGLEGGHSRRRVVHAGGSAPGGASCASSPPSWPRRRA